MAKTESSDLALVKRLVLQPRGLSTKSFSRAERMSSKTPDLKIFCDEELLGYCEVKSPRDEWLDDLLDQAAPGQIVGGLRDDPTFNRIARNIEKAAAQLEAVNKDGSLLNVLAIVNHADANDISDLREVLEGQFRSNGGEVFPTITNISERWLGDTRFKIDLYIWIDAKRERIGGMIINERDTDKVNRLGRVFGFDVAKIAR
jgi:hypothetical protein